MVESWMQKTYPQNRNRVPSFVQNELENNKEMTTRQFSVVVFIVSVFASIGITISLITQYYFVFLGISFFFAINIFSHPLQSLYLKRYTPGVITSLLLVIPYYGMFFYHFYDTELFALKTIVAALVLVVVFIPLFLLGHKIGEKFR